jgi:hypothetical protein
MNFVVAINDNGQEQIHDITSLERCRFSLLVRLRRERIDSFP